MRRLWLWALAPAISVTTFALAAIALPLVGQPWLPLPVLGFVAVFGLSVVALFRFVLRARLAHALPAERGKWPAIVGWLIGAALLSSYFVLGVGAPASISQTFDNVFHLNAIAHIEATQNASPLDIVSLTAPNGGSGFYPVAWHAMVQLVAQLSGVSIAVAINVFNLAALAIAWPTGIILLSRQVAGRSTIVTLAAGILSAAFASAPLHMLHYGVLYPYFLGLLFVPVTVAAAMQLFRVTNDRLISQWYVWAVLLLGLLPATMLSHPGATMAAFALSVPIVCVATFRAWPRLSASARVLRVAIFVAFSLAGIFIVWKLGIEDFWGPRLSRADALKRVATLSMNGYGFQLLITALVVVAIVFALRRRNAAGIAAAGFFLIAIGLYFVTAGVSNYWLRIVTQLWYGDAPRLGAIVPIAAIPVAALGVRALLEQLPGARTRTSESMPASASASASAHAIESTSESANARGGPTALQAVALVLLLVFTQLGSGMFTLVQHLRSSYTATPTAALLSDDEIALLERLPSEVQPGEVIAGNPWTGAALAYAFAHRPVVLTHMFMTDPGSDRDLVMSELRDAAERPEVCDAVDRLNVRWVLDFGKNEVHGGDHRYPGIEDLAASDSVVEVDREGDAVLYRVTACE